MVTNFILDTIVITSGLSVKTSEKSERGKVGRGVMRLHSKKDQFLFVFTNCKTKSKVNGTYKKKKHYVVSYPLYN